MRRLRPTRAGHLRLLVAAAIAATASSVACAATIHVPADQPSIGAGIGAANTGDMVLVACDTYYENDLELTEGITLASETGEAGCVTINAGGTGKAISISGGDPVVVRGITFTNGSAIWGGAVEVDTTSVAFENCAFTSNQVTYLGGALFIENPSRVDCSFTDCSFADNWSESSGGAIWLELGSTLFTR